MPELLLQDLLPLLKFSFPDFSLQPFETLN